MLVTYLKTTITVEDVQKMRTRAIFEDNFKETVFIDYLKKRARRKNIIEAVTGRCFGNRKFWKFFKTFESYLKFWQKYIFE